MRVWDCLGSVINMHNSYGIDFVGGELTLQETLSVTHENSYRQVNDNTSKYPSGGTQGYIERLA